MVSLTSKTTAQTVDKAEMAGEKVRVKALLAAEKLQARKAYEAKIKAIDADSKNAQTVLSANYQISQKALKDALKAAQETYAMNDSIEDASFRESNAKIREDNKAAKDFAKETFDSQIEEINSRSA